jgi:hypothetical protein
MHAQTVGLNAMTTMARHRSQRGAFSLDILFYRTCPINGAGLVGQMPVGGLQPEDVRLGISKSYVTSVDLLAGLHEAVP